MNRLALTGLFVVTACFAGCTEPPRGTIKTMGDIDPGLALPTARDVLATYYDIDSMDAQTLVIKCRPKDSEGHERLLGGSPMRETAKLHLFRAEGQLAAEVSVAKQRQAGPVSRAILANDNYSSIPNQTPAEVEGATTTEQNQSWQPAGRDYQAEQKILDDLYIALHPELRKAASTQPATAPAP